MKEQLLTKGTGLRFGDPAVPIPDVIVDAIGQVVAQVPGIAEAYLPQFQIEGESESRQVLVLGVDSSKSIPEVIEELTQRMSLVMGPDQILDMLPFSVESLPEEARHVECFRRDRPKRSWWKFW